MSEVNQWVKNLIFIVLMTTFLQMFLPENNMRRYVRVVMGFFIIMIFISPLAAIFNQDYDFDAIYRIFPDSNINNNWNQIKEKGKRIESSNQTLLNDYYQEKVSKKIKKIAELDFPDRKKKVEVEINEHYQLAGIKLTLHERKKIKNVKIDPVDLEANSSDKEEKSKSYKDIQPQIDSLRKKLAKAFQISVTNIEVIVSNRGEENGFDE